jgi:hypothetical protein
MSCDACLPSKHIAPVMFDQPKPDGSRPVPSVGSYANRLDLWRELSACVKAPDDAVMARYVLQLGGPGFVRTKTLKAFPETAYREIIRSLGALPP